jgi:hypothetical protein
MNNYILYRKNIQKLMVITKNKKSNYLCGFERTNTMENLIEISLFVDISNLVDDKEKKKKRDISNSTINSAIIAQIQKLI